MHDALENLHDIASLASQLGVGEPTLKDMIEEMKKPGRDHVMKQKDRFYVVMLCP